MQVAKAMFFHHERITTIAGATRLRAKHVEIMSLMIAIEKAIDTERHAQRYRTGSAAVSNEIRGPN